MNARSMVGSANAWQPVGRDLIRGEMVATIRNGPVFRYGLAFLATAVGLVVRLGVADWIPPGFPYVTFFPAVVLTAYFAGLRPAILCALLSGAAAWWFFIPPAHSFVLNGPTAIALIFYAFVVTIDIFFIDGMRRAIGKLAIERERYARLAESRDLLYRELHHRVSNNIQVVGALLRLQAASVKDGDAKHALAEAGGRIELVAKIQRQLHDRTGDPMPFSAFAEELLVDATTAAGLKVSIEISGGDAPLPADQATPVTLVMLECFNNAIEHGFANRVGGAVWVHMEDAGAEHVLTVTDDGAGPAPDFDLANTRSLGLRIVQAMAAQLGGKFTLSRVGDVTTCQLRYPA